MNVAKPDREAESSPSVVAPDRRAILLVAATATAGSAIGTSSVRAQDATAGNFGAPVVEVCVPFGVLTLEQKGAMVRGITDVILKAMKRSPDPERRLFVTITETAEGGFGVNGQVFVPQRK